MPLVARSRPCSLLSLSPATQSHRVSLSPQHHHGSNHVQRLLLLLEWPQLRRTVCLYECARVHLLRVRVPLQAHHAKNVLRRPVSVLLLRWWAGLPTEQGVRCTLRPGQSRPPVLPQSGLLQASSGGHQIRYGKGRAGGRRTARKRGDGGPLSSKAVIVALMCVGADRPRAVPTSQMRIRPRWGCPHGLSAGWALGSVEVRSTSSAGHLPASATWVGLDRVGRGAGATRGPLSRKARCDLKVHHRPWRRTRRSSRRTALAGLGAGARLQVRAAHRMTGW